MSQSLRKKLTEWITCLLVESSTRSYRYSIVFSTNELSFALFILTGVASWPCIALLSNLLRTIYGKWWKSNVTSQSNILCFMDTGTLPSHFGTNIFERNIMSRRLLIYMMKNKPNKVRQELIPIMRIDVSSDVYEDIQTCSKKHQRFTSLYLKDTNQILIRSAIVNLEML